MTLMLFLIAVQWLVILGLIVALLAMARQIGVLYERISPLGALVNDSGPQIGQKTPRFEMESLTGGTLSIGSPSGRAMLIFFLSPTCPVCKKLLPVLRSVRQAESGWLDVTLASDGDQAKHRRFIETAGLGDFPYVLSTELGLAYRVARLPFAVLVDGEGVIRSKGLINNREQLESLFNAHDMGVNSIQDYIDRPITANG